LNNSLKPKHVASNEIYITLVVVECSYFLFPERESLGVARECESDGVDTTMIYKESQEWETRVDSGGDDKGDEKANKFHGKRTKIFRTKIVEKGESLVQWCFGLPTRATFPLTLCFPYGNQYGRPQCFAGNIPVW